MSGYKRQPELFRMICIRRLGEQRMLKFQTKNALNLIKIPRNMILKIKITQVMMIVL